MLLKLERLRLVAGGPARLAAAAFAGYAVIGFLYLGLPLLGGGGRYVGNGHDPQIFIWSFAWWPHAILHGENPFVTHAVWAPDGVNLAWVTAVPGLALLFAPVTLTVGPIVSYDVAAVLMPALAAWTAFLLCRHLTRAVWPSLVGGYLFGFSSYLLAQMAGGHLNLSSVFLLPLVALLALRFLDGELDGRGLVVRLGPVLALQVLISTEIAFTVTLALLLALGLSALLAPSRRGRLARLLPGLLGAYAFAALLTAPLLYYAVTGFKGAGFYPQDSFTADLVNFVVPTNVTLVGGGWAMPVSSRFPANFSEQGAYLGLPAVLAVGLLARRAGRAPGGRFVLASLAVGVVAALGAHGVVDGHRVLPLPWVLVHRLPLFDNTLADRLTVFTALVAGVAVALWASSRPSGRAGRVGRVVLPLLAVLAIVPNPGAGVWTTAYEVPPFFSAAAYRTCLDPGENVLPLPITGGTSDLWQAVSGFRFTMAGGDLGNQSIPPSFETPPARAYITGGGWLHASQTATLRALLVDKHVTSVVVEPAQAARWAEALDRLATPQQVGGVLLYHLTSTPPSCLGA